MASNKVSFYQKHFSKNPKSQTGFGATPRIGYTEEVEVKGVTAAPKKKKTAEKPTKKKIIAEKSTQKKTQKKKPVPKKTHEYPFFAQ